MSTINNVTSNIATAYGVQASYAKPKEKADEKTSTRAKDDTAVVYEKSSSSEKSTIGAPKNNQAIVAQMKLDMQTRTEQLRNLVEKTITKQGSTLGTADDMWSWLANGNLQDVDSEAVEQAKADVAEDGYWGAEATSDRILDFAKALSGGDQAKANQLLDAFKKGYEQATKAWGKELPSLSSQTYDLVEKKFNKWMEEAQ